jgi:hypothetical protein
MGELAESAVFAHILKARSVYSPRTSPVMFSNSSKVIFAGEASDLRLYLLSDGFSGGLVKFAASLVGGKFVKLSL